MNAGGAVLVVVGLWVVCQVLGGNALERLNVVTGTGTTKSLTPLPPTGNLLGDGLDAARGAIPK